jgi:hypothetical protein
MESNPLAKYPADTAPDTVPEMSAADLGIEGTPADRREMSAADLGVEQKAETAQTLEDAERFAQAPEAKPSAETIAAEKSQMESVRARLDERAEQSRAEGSAEQPLSYEEKKRAFQEGPVREAENAFGRPFKNVNSPNELWRRMHENLTDEETDHSTKRLTVAGLVAMGGVGGALAVGPGAALGVALTGLAAPVLGAGILAAGAAYGIMRWRQKKQEKRSRAKFDAISAKLK